MSPKDEIEELKSRVDRIENWIRTVTQSRQAAARDNEEAEHAEESKFELVSFDVKKVRDTEESLLPKYAYKLQVQNLTDRKIRLNGKIIFLDADNFELEDSPIGLFTVPAAQLFATSGLATLLTRENQSAIADIKAVLEVF